MSLLGKKALVVGGNGFVGNYLAARMVQNGAAVTSLSRSGIKHQFKENDQIEWLMGDVMNPQKYATQINEADVIVHTVGTLFDSSVTKGAQPGEPGTYEQVNRDTFGSLLKNLTSRKKIIYLSSSAHPPLLPRYLSTKHQAEAMLFQSEHQGYSLRPGFIHNWEHRKWSVPLRYGLIVYNKIFPLIESMAPSHSALERHMKGFRQGECTPLEELGDATVELALNGSAQKMVEQDAIHELSRQYRKGAVK